jgi:hypothetical protein
MTGYRSGAHRPDYSVYARLGDATGLGRFQRLRGNGSSPQIAVGADGTAVAAWVAYLPPRRAEVLRVAIARAGQDFGRVQTLSRAHAVALGGVGVSAQGRAVVAWRLGTSGRSQTPVQVALAAPGRRFGAMQTLGNSEYDPPAVTVSPNGTVVVAWLNTPTPPPPLATSPPEAYTARLLATTITPHAATFAPATELAALNDWSRRPDATSGPGGAVVTWRHAADQKRLVSLTPQNVFEPAVALPPSTYNPEKDDHLALGIPADATTVALWREVRTRNPEDPSETFAAIYSCVRPPGGEFSSAAQVSTPGWLAGPPHAGALTDRTVAAWTETRADRVRLRIAARRSGHAWTTLHRLLTPRIDINSVNVAASPRYAVVTWIQQAVAASRQEDRCT